jgi:rsbT co-antagonist protein RsbR
VVDHIVRMARCVKLLGADCSVSGVRPEVARTIIELGSELGDIQTYPTLRAALTGHIGGLLSSERRPPAANAAG